MGVVKGGNGSWGAGCWMVQHNISQCSSFELRVRFLSSLHTTVIYQLSYSVRVGSRASIHICRAPTWHNAFLSISSGQDFFVVPTISQYPRARFFCYHHHWTQFLKSTLLYCIVLWSLVCWSHIQDANCQRSCTLGWRDRCFQRHCPVWKLLYFLITRILLLSNEMLLFQAGFKRRV